MNRITMTTFGSRWQKLTGLWVALGPSTNNKTRFSSVSSSINCTSTIMPSIRTQTSERSTAAFRSKMAKVKQAIKMGKTYNTNDADMSLISSDDRLFKVHFARMKSISYDFSSLPS